MSTSDCGARQFHSSSASATNPSASASVCANLRAPGGKPSGVSAAEFHAGDGCYGKSVNAARRSSTRSIKRKKFDDEIVESGSSCGPAARIGSVNVDQIPIAASLSGVNEPLKRRGKVACRNKRCTNPAFSAYTGGGGSADVASTRDIGRWKPTDDLALILSTHQTCDLVHVHLGVKFSCMFTLREIRERWHALLFDASVSHTAVEAMRTLTAEQVDEVERRTLYSAAEERLLKDIGGDDPPSIERLQTLIDENLDVFHSSRTAQRLRKYWLQLHQYQLLSDQTPTRPHIDPSAGALSDDNPVAFSDIEESIDDASLLAAPPESDLVEREHRANHLLGWHQINSCESQARGWQVLVDHVTGVSPPAFDKETLAILRGRTVRYLMRSAEVTLGRSSSSSSSDNASCVDIDLSLEGPAAKVSRRQAVIRLVPGGQFALVNVGRRVVYVDGKPVLPCAKCHLYDETVLQVATLSFVFLVNHELVDPAKHSGVVWQEDSAGNSSRLSLGPSVSSNNNV